jgi:hypothetical protein
MDNLMIGTLVQPLQQENRPLKWHVGVQVAGVLLLVLAAATLSMVNPPAVRAQGTQNGTYSLRYNATTTIYANLTAAAQTVLVTVCVTTSGTPSVTLQEGPVLSTIATVKFGQCQSLTVVLEADATIQIKAPPGANAAGTYIVSLF